MNKWNESIALPALHPGDQMMKVFKPVDVRPVPGLEAEWRACELAEREAEDPDVG
jgi:hypothetical protein